MHSPALVKRFFMPSEPNQTEKLAFMDLAIDLANQNVAALSGGPFGAVIVKDGKVIATGANSVTSTNDPTAHAEIVAIRKACEVLGTFQLDGCEIYTSCEPCPMCLGAIYWARPAAVYYAATHVDAANAGFDDSFIYEEMALPKEARNLKMIHLPHERSFESFEKWKREVGRIDY